jgi:hypothetical protein
MLFRNQSMKVFPRGRTGVRSCCGAKLSKACQAQEDAWAHSCSFRNHLLLNGTIAPGRCGLRFREDAHLGDNETVGTGVWLVLKVAA